MSVALTSFFFTFFEVFLNGFRGLFVALNPRLTEGAKGWQALFSLFKKFFEPQNGPFEVMDYTDCAEKSRIRTTNLRVAR
jgi:hypothetical protein